MDPGLDQSSTKTKMMELNGKGKLTNTPKRSPRKITPNARRIEMKHGKFVTSLRVSLSYSTKGDHNHVGRKIDDILSGHARIPSTAKLKVEGPQPVAKTTKTTHPFFLAIPAFKVKNPALSVSDASSAAQASDDEMAAPGSPKGAKPWKDIIFSNPKPSQSRFLSPLLDVIWPPLGIQHIRPAQNHVSNPLLRETADSRHKSKQPACPISESENILLAFASGLKSDLHRPTVLHQPSRHVMSGRELASALENERNSGTRTSTHAVHPATELLKSRIIFKNSAFDRGVAAGPHMWTQEYAPRRWEEVLQPQCRVLHDWLSSLKIHQIRNAKSLGHTRLLGRKKRRKKHANNDMDDFIITTDEDEQDGGDDSAIRTKNAILIVGPPGCGKTASVFAVANQLGFEVFEIHPGMRRSAKDIFDKVGDMTQNHLVQQTKSLSRGSSVATDDLDDLSSHEVVSSAQRPMAQFMRPDAKKKQQDMPQQGRIKELKARIQTQSLILFEEVDILFDDDKYFWSGVQSLIEQSKRPVIMTCNDMSSIPFDDLDLFTVLSYECPEPDIATEYLTYLAAAEGHHLQRPALRTLYLSKGRDLRAAITELNFWCQMTVGSQRGGLDWMLSEGQNGRSRLDGSSLRIVSKDTFFEGLDLVPDESLDQEELLCFAQDVLHLSAREWDRYYSSSPAVDGPARLALLEDMVTGSEARSALDIFDPTIAPLVGAAIIRALPSCVRPVERNDVQHAYLNKGNEAMTRGAVADALEALMEDHRTFPPSVGRAAPSIDSHPLSLVTEVAPFVRSIVLFDQRLEQQRNELGGGSQGKKQRTTRAARAALEGSSKAQTRREKWFPKELDFARVLDTGAGWPRLDPATDLKPTEPNSSSQH